MKFGSVSLVIAAILPLAWPTASIASPIGFIGATVSADYRWPSLGAVLYESGTAIVDGQIEFRNIGGFGIGVSPAVDFSQANITVSYPVGFSLAGTGSFDGWAFTALDGAPGITGVSLSGSNIPGFTAARLSFDETHVYANTLGLGTLAPGSSISIDVRFTSTPVLGLGEYIMSVIKPALKWSPGTIDMSATFEPVGRTLTQAAELGGYDHFNWYQIATEYPGSSLLLHPAPFVDPPYGRWWGGLGAQFADTLPFYWDETDCFGCEAEFNLHDPSNTAPDDKTLRFSDLPANNFISVFGGKMSFTTYLAGIRSDGTWDALGAYNWSSNYHCDPDEVPAASDCGGLAAARNLTPFPIGGTGGILDASEVFDLADLPLNVRELMVLDGAANVSATPVPEPASLFLVASGLCALLVRSARSRYRDRAF
jgi:hypothetical protein